MCLLGFSKEKKIYVQLLQIECGAKEGEGGERKGERERTFRELVYMIWALASQMSAGQ